MITRDDGAHFVAGGVRAGGVLRAADRRDDKLIGGENQFRGDARMSGGCGLREQTRATFALRGEHSRGREHVDDIPFFGGPDEGGGALLREIDLEKARAPEIAFVRVTARLFRAVDDLTDLSGGDGEAGFLAVQPHAERRHSAAAARDFVAPIHRRHFVGPSGFIDGGFVMAKLKGGSQFQPGQLRAGGDLIADVNRVLQMRQENALLDHQIAHLVDPNRQAVFETKLAQVIGALQVKLAASALFRA